jgi:mannosyltransferase OCH1-like enzyme
MKSYIKTLEIVSIIFITLMLCKFVNVMTGITFFIIGIFLYFFFNTKTYKNIPSEYKLLYNLAINKDIKFKIQGNIYVREPVPKKIYRTWCTSSPIGTCGGRNIDLNVINTTQKILYDWEQIIYGDKEIDDFLYKEFGKDDIVTKAYYLINPKYGASRADLFRYLIIYKYGGLYLDMKSCVTKYLPSLPDNMDMWVSKWNYFIKSTNPHSNLFDGGEYQNWYIYARKGASILKNIIEQVIDNIYKLHNNPDITLNITSHIHCSTKAKGLVLSVTGPVAMTIAIIKSENNNSVYFNNNINNYLSYNCTHNNKINNNHYSLQTETLIKPNININYIPKVVYMTYHELEIIPLYVKNNIYKYCNGYDIQIYNDDMCVEFLNKYYGNDAVLIFNNMRFPAHKADFWRYCILYIFGGHYFDIKTDFQVDINKIFNTTLQKTWYTVLCYSKKCIYNGIIVTPPENPILLSAIQNIYKNNNTNYEYYINKLFKIVNKNLVDKIKIGNNIQKNGWNCIIFEEQCVKCEDKTKCDRYGFDCIIKNDIGEKIFNTRYKDFPWKPKTYISMTTIPERLINEWFLNNLKRHINLLSDNQTLILNLPTESLKGHKYIIPDNVNDLQGDKFIINICEKDEGPITKLLPTLRNNLVRDIDTIIICDDDIVYKENTFNLLENNVIKNKNKIITICNKNIEGFKGFAFQKKILKGILDISIPLSCVRIDDDVISWYVKHNNIQVYIINKNLLDPMCSLYKDSTDTHPSWDELNKDNRKPMVKKCIEDLEHN